MPSAPVAVLVHGAGSSTDFVLRAMGSAVCAQGWEPLAIAHMGCVDEAGTAIDEVARRREVRVVGGISIGAHAAATWASSRSHELAGLLLVMPAWTGAARRSAASRLTHMAAAQITEEGSATVLEQLLTDPALAGDWVLEELARAWPQYGDSNLVAALRAAAASPAPTLDDLRRLVTPTGVVALAEDPLHPESVAAAWAAALPHSAMHVVPRHAPKSDRAVLGAAAVAAWSQVVSGSR